MKIEQYKNEKLETDRINFNKLAELYTDIEYVKAIVLIKTIVSTIQV